MICLLKCIARGCKNVLEVERGVQANPLEPPAYTVRHHLLLLHNQVHDKRSIAELLHVYINRALLAACEVGVFFKRNITTL